MRRIRAKHALAWEQAQADEVGLFGVCKVSHCYSRAHVQVHCEVTSTFCAALSNKLLQQPSVAYVALQTKQIAPSFETHSLLATFSWRTIQ
jgi:hypothetical protein